jgi:gamma-butyrobetaine dioxygenase
MKSLQKSRQLLLSQPLAIRCAGKRIRLSAGYLQARTLQHGRPQRVPADKEHNSGPHRNAFAVNKENVIFEDGSKASSLEIPTSSYPKEFSPALLEKTPDLDLEFVKTGPPPYFHPAYLRDACRCSRCVDPSSTQKNFQTTDIPRDIKASSVEEAENGDLKITWENDIPGFGEDHVSIFPKKFFDTNRSRLGHMKDRFNHLHATRWDKNLLAANLSYVTYDEWMTDDIALQQAQFSLHKLGIVIVRDVPESEMSVEALTGRLGPIRDSFYGRTWDVKSVPQAKNVAYTHQYLGLHMDLLYMASPPGFQFLHCIKNSCKGGESIFVDSFNAARQLNNKDFARLSRSRAAFHYRNAGEHYYHEHPVFEVKAGNMHDSRPSLTCVNYSPPFQANAPYSQQQQRDYTEMLRSLRRFAEKLESPPNLFEYKLQPGECVIFNNRRILHGRRQFEAAEGERWLKGAYVDTDVFMSRFRVLMERYHGKDVGLENSVPRRTQYVFPEVNKRLVKQRKVSGNDRVLFDISGHS